MRATGPGAHLARVERLRNGLTLWLRPHREPRGALAIGLVVAAGSLGESQDERGLSHFLEHLAFRGGHRMTRADLARFQERFGVRLGREQNAFTTFDRTCYTLKLRDVGQEGIEAGLRWMADVAFGLRLAPGDVDAERRIVLEEMRARDQVSSRLHHRVLEQLAPPLHARDPLGDPASLQALTADDIRRCYERWYVPERSTLIVVGDLSRTEMVRLARRTFGDWPRRSDESRRPKLDLPGLDGSRVVRVHDPEVERPQVRVLGLGRSAIPRSPGELARALATETALWLAAYRLSDAFPTAHTSVTPLVAGWQAVETATFAPASDLETRLSGMAEALATATTASITSAELSLARRRLLANARSLAAREGSSGGLFDELVAVAGHDQPPPLAAAVCARAAQRLARTLTRAQLRGRLADLAPTRGVVVLLVAPGERGAHEDERLTRLFARKVAAAPAWRQARKRPRPLGRLPGIRGERATTHLQRRFGVLDLDLANGVRAHVKAVRRRPRLVRVAATLVGGRLEETAATLGLTAAATLAFARPTTLGRPAREIRDLLAVRSVSLGCSIDEDVVTLEVVCGPRDLEWALALLRELLSEPRVDKETLSRWQERIEASELARRPSVEHVLATETLRLLTGDDPRFRLIPAARARAVRRDVAQRWLLGRICAAPTEVAVVGGISRTRAAELTERCFGTLDARPTESARLDALRQLTVATGPLESEHVLAGARDRAAALVGWRVAPWHRHDERMRLQLASEILGVRLHTEVRERRGLAYDVSCTHSPSRAYPQASLLSASFFSDARTLREATRVTREVVERLADEGPTTEELDAARRRLHALALEARKDPRFWARTLAEQRLRRRRLDEVDAAPASILSVSPGEVQAALARYVVEPNRLLVLCNPGD